MSEINDIETIAIAVGGKLIYHSPEAQVRVAAAQATREADKDSRFDGVGLEQDDDGWYVHTHRARGDSYPTPEDIPQSEVDWIESTGSKQAASLEWETNHDGDTYYTAEVDEPGVGVGQFLVDGEDGVWTWIYTDATDEDFDDDEAYDSAEEAKAAAEEYWGSTTASKVASDLTCDFEDSSGKCGNAATKCVNVDEPSGAVHMHVCDDHEGMVESDPLSSVIGPVSEHSGAKTAAPSSTYEIKKVSDPVWTPVITGDDVEALDEAVRQLGIGSSAPSTVVLVKSNFNGSVTVFVVDPLGNFDSVQSYEQFYGAPYTGAKTAEAVEPVCPECGGPVRKVTSRDDEPFFECTTCGSCTYSPKTAAVEGWQQDGDRWTLEETDVQGLVGAHGEARVTVTPANSFYDPAPGTYSASFIYKIVGFGDGAMVIDSTKYGVPLEEAKRLAEDFMNESLQAARSRISSKTAASVNGYEIVEEDDGWHAKRDGGDLRFDSEQDARDYAAGKKDASTKIASWQEWTSPPGSDEGDWIYMGGARGYASVWNDGRWEISDERGVRQTGGKANSAEVAKEAAEFAMADFGFPVASKTAADATVLNWTWVEEDGWWAAELPVGDPGYSAKSPRVGEEEDGTWTWWNELGEGDDGYSSAYSAMLSAEASGSWRASKIAESTGREEPNSTAFYVKVDGKVTHGPYASKDTAQSLLRNSRINDPDKWANAEVVELPSIEDEDGWHTAPLGTFSSVKTADEWEVQNDGTKFVKQYGQWSGIITDLAGQWAKTPSKSDLMKDYDPQGFSWGIYHDRKSRVGDGLGGTEPTLEAAKAACDAAVGRQASVAAGKECPKCGSTDTVHASAVDFGEQVNFGSNNYRCNACGSYWDSSATAGARDAWGTGVAPRTRVAAPEPVGVVWAQAEPWNVNDEDDGFFEED